jgi:hypothetical protein
MKKSFTLIELLVTVGIIVLLAAAAGPALIIHKNQANLDTAVTKIKDGILETQNYAFAPERSPVDGYVFVLNMSETKTYYYYGVGLSPRSYGIFAMGGTNKLIKNVQINIPVTLSSSNPGYYDATYDFFKIYFRVKDGVAGCNGIYYDDLNWNTACASGGDYAEIQVSFANKSKTIRIHKITGQVEVQ